MQTFRRNVYSQNGEDGVIAEVFRRLGVVRGRCCEFGAADGYWLSNTRALVDLGWEGLFLEAAMGQIVTPENVNDLIPAQLDLLSIDIDGNDYAVWRAYRGRPTLVVIEINSSYRPGVMRFTRSQGCSFSMMNKLADEKGYALLCHTGNCVYIRKDLLAKFPDADPAFRRNWNSFIVEARKKGLHTCAINNPCNQSGNSIQWGHEGGSTSKETKADSHSAEG